MHAVAPCPCFFVQVSRFQLLERGRWCEGEIEREREGEREKAGLGGGANRKQKRRRQG